MDSFDTVQARTRIGAMNRAIGAPMHRLTGEFPFYFQRAEAALGAPVHGELPRPHT